MKKILFVMNSLSTGGAEKVLVNILNHLSPEKYDVTLLTVFDNVSESNKLERRVRRKSVIHIKNKYMQGVVYKFFSRICSSSGLYKQLIKDKYDVEIAFLEGLPTKIIAGSSNQKSRKIAWVHIDLKKFRDSDYCFRNIKEQKKCYEKYDKVVAVSEGVKGAFIDRFSPKVCCEVHYNPVDEKEVREKSVCPVNNPPFTKQGFHFISVGRLHRQKGFERLIKAASKLRKMTKADFEVCIVGEGDERSKLEDMIHELGMEDHVKLYGYSNNPYQLMIQADCMVISSYAEGWPLVCIEALILGIPVVSTNITGPQEIIGNGKWGLIVENDTESIANGMFKIMDFQTRDKYRELAETRGKQFKIETTMKAIEELFDEGK